MKTLSAFQPSIAKSYTTKFFFPSIYSRFMRWCTLQQKNRLMWLGISITAQGCIFTPITIMAILLAGTNLFLFMLAMIAMGASLVTNLAALPTKITIPVFALSLIIDAGIIVGSFYI
ncbi:MAG: hypothetical protein ACJ748_00090 [Flavisolibacter sp.]